MNTLFPLAAPSRLLALALLGATLAPPAWTCGGGSAGPAEAMPDLDWIRVDQTIFVADPISGLHRLQFKRDEKPAIINLHPGHVENVQLSPDRRWLLFSLPTPQRDFRLYETATQRMLPVGQIPRNAVSFAFSPDSQSLAWTSLSSSDVQTLHIPSMTTRRFSQPTEAPRTTIVHGLTWSHTGDRILVNFGAGLQSSWSLDPASEQYSPVDAVETARTGIPLSNIRYSVDGKELGTYCQFCSYPAKASMAFSDGTEVRMTPERAIVLTEPGKPAVTIEALPAEKPRDPNEPVLACGGRSLTLLDSFDGRYILYRLDGTPWLYGLAEKRKAPLSTKPYAYPYW